MFKNLVKPLLAWYVNIFKVDNADFGYYEHFDYWQDKGFYLIPKHFYQPIPDTSEFGKSYFRKKFSLRGVNMNDNKQLGVLGKFRKFSKEYSMFETIDKTIDDQKDPNFYFGNLAFDGIDALIYYCMIRTLKPGTIIEVGSGWSTKLAARASIANGKTKLVSIEPFPQPILTKGFDGLTKLVRKRVQEVPISFFKTLKKNDILFIDSSHTVKAGGDVNYLILEVLPSLPKGVFVHFHDIFFPDNYPKEWVVKEHRFWAEQYLLHAFLLFNKKFRIVYANNYMFSKHLPKVRSVFKKSPNYSGGSIWIKSV